jgi:hypothetical protein
MDVVEKIVNGDFSAKVDTGEYSNPVGWISTETNVRQVSLVSDRLVFNRGGSAVGGSAEQTVDATIGREVNFSLDYIENGGGGNPSVRVELIDGNGIIIFTQDVTVNGTKVEYSFVATTDTYTVRLTDTSTGDLSSHDAQIDNVSFDVTCFGRGTKIMTPSGPILIEHIKPGQIVCNANGAQNPVRWSNSRVLDAIDLAQNPNLKPILIPAGALGNSIPDSDLIVSPQHRILLRSKIVRRVFGVDEVLVAAKKLIGYAGIKVLDDAKDVEYFHLAFDKHEIVISNGAESESLFFGPMALQTLGEDAVKEIGKLFPDIDISGENNIPARPIAVGKKINRMIERHSHGNKNLVCHEPLAL